MRNTGLRQIRTMHAQTPVHACTGLQWQEQFAYMMLGHYDCTCLDECACTGLCLRVLRCLIVKGLTAL